MTLLLDVKLNNKIFNISKWKVSDEDFRILLPLYNSIGVWFKKHCNEICIEIFVHVNGNKMQIISNDNNTRMYKYMNYLVEIDSIGNVILFNNLYVVY